MAADPESDLVKVSFKLDPTDWHGVEIETLWGELVQDQGPLRIILRNSPFFATGVSFLDTIAYRLAKDENGAFVWFDGVTARGGHSTCIILTEMVCPQFAKYWFRLAALNCFYESSDDHTHYGHKMMYSVDIPPGTDIDAVRAVLDQGAADGVWIVREENIEHQSRR